MGRSLGSHHPHASAACRAVLPALAALAACTGGSGTAPKTTAFTPQTHTPFQIAAGVHATACNTCHGAFDSFQQVDCLSCHAHQQAATDRVHNPSAVPLYGATGYQSDRCYSCHKTDDGTIKAYSHAGIVGDCTSCHDVGAPFAALPITGFTHPVTGGADCAGCHTPASWKGATSAPASARDPAQDVAVSSWIPSFSQTSISSVSFLTQALPMPMNHGAAALPAAASSACANCHAGAATGNYFPGVLHASLDALKLQQPAACAECHATSAPAGLVGPLAAHPARTPPSGEMAHDAVAWSGGARTQTKLVDAECATCHVTAGWGQDPTQAGPALFHPSLTKAAKAQPGSCLDCHANSRPAAPLTSANAALPAGLGFDHGVPAALADCAACHAASAGAAPPFGAWSGGRYHLAGGSTPATCLPCHAGERPTSTQGWKSATFTQAPFDYGTNQAGNTHGAGLDCVTCHAGPGSGAWGGTQDWQGGAFGHGAGSLAATTCVACHEGQRPDLQPGATAAAVAALLGFDHAQNGQGDCYGCHQATVTAGRYQSYGTPVTLKNSGDWQGGQSYPGSTLVSSSHFVALPSLSLVRSGGLIRSTTQTNLTLYNAMLHVSAAIPAALNAGPTASPDNTKCWHCHTNTNGTVTSYSNGVFHASLKTYSATPGGPVVPFPQPSSTCLDCHKQMRPPGIVEGAAASLQPMDHSAAFTGPVTLGGVSVTAVSGMECALCHSHPGDTWTDGVFHANIGSATPADCAACHYPLMADATKADVSAGSAQAGTQYAMKHASAVLTFQSCDTCHAGALAKAAGAAPASTTWSGGLLHASLPAQPTTCTACHAGPAANASTQSSVRYALPQGLTATNANQWMNHGAADAAAKDCASCHLADAQKSSTNAWSKSTPFHAKVAAPADCRSCHGLTNGGGSVPGTNNNLPAGATDSTTATSAGSTTGVSSTTKARIDHADVNVAGLDCNACHTQLGPASGGEWAKATFHAAFTAANPLKLGPTTGRCSTCHINEKPTAVFTAQDHSTFTATSGTQDCASCHTYPGTGSASAPNWLGAAGVPTFINVGGFPIPQPPAASAGVVQAGISSLPHPTVPAGTACTACHATSAGGTGAIGYDHLSTLIKTNCDSCHEAGSNLVGTPWNKAATKTTGAGDTRPFTLTTATATYKGNTKTFTVANHFYTTTVVVDCSFCHVVPPAPSYGQVTTGTAYTTAWAFKHPPEGTCSNSCKTCHSGGCPN